MTKEAIIRKAMRILAEGREISPGVYADIDREELQDILASGASVALRELAPLRRRARVRLYRAIHVSGREQIDLNHLGIYWTWSAESPSAYWERGAGRAIIVVGTVASNDVDWLTTAALIALRSLDELEIRVRPQAPIRVLSIDDKKVVVQGRA